MNLNHFSLSFDTDNAAFEDEPGEIARILRDLADRIERGGITRAEGPVRDLNGNTVGRWSLT